MSYARTIMLALMALVGAAGVFVVSTVLNGVIANEVVAFACAVGVFGGAAVVGRLNVLKDAWSSSRPAILVAAAGGALAWFGAPLLVMTQRASDAPPGAEVAFFTLASWGLLTVLVGAFAGHDRSPVTLTAALLALLGGAVLLGSWEFPSSLSPFVRFPTRHSLMLVAGGLFAGGSAMLLTATRTIPAKAALVAGSLGAVVVGLVTAGPALLPPDASTVRGIEALFVLAVLGALFSVGWFLTMAEHGLARASGVLFLAPAALTTLTALERMMRVHGPDPVRWSAALSGIILTATGVALIWVSTRGSEARTKSPTPAPASGSTSSTRLELGVIAIILALGAASLWLPAVRGKVEGSFEQVYRAVWTMMGAETASGWLGFVVCALAAAAVWSRLRDGGVLPAATALCALAASATYPLIAATPLRTATLWIPADVQQTYGTEYARLEFVAMHEPLRLATFAVVVVVSLAVITDGLRAQVAGAPSEGER